MCAFGLFVLSGSIYQYVLAGRRTGRGEAEIVKVDKNSASILTGILPPFTITYRFAAESEIINAQGAYDIEPPSATAAVAYEPANPKNNSLLLPSRQQNVITLIAIVIIASGGWLIRRTLKK